MSGARRLALPNIPISFSKSRRELECLDKFDEYIRNAQSRSKEAVTKNLNLAARTATMNLTSKEGLKHTVDCVAAISKDVHSHKETAVYLVDSIMVHAAHYCDESMLYRYERGFMPLLSKLFKRVMAEKRGQFRDALVVKFLNKILPKWEEHGWFDEATDKIKESLLKKSSAAVKMQYVTGETPVLPHGPDDDIDNDDGIDALEEESTKAEVAQAIRAIGAIKMRAKYGASQVKSQPGGTPSQQVGTPKPGENTTPQVIPKSDVLKLIPRTPKGLETPVLKQIPKTPKELSSTAGAIPGTPRNFHVPGTPRIGQIPGTPTFPVLTGVQPVTPVFTGVQPVTPGLERRPMTPRGPQPVTPAPGGAQPFTPATPATLPRTPALSAQPFTPAPGSSAQPFTPAPGSSSQPFTPAPRSAQPFTPAPGSSAQPFTPAPGSSAQPFTPAAILSSAQPTTPVGTPVGPPQPLTPAPGSSATAVSIQAAVTPGTPGRRRGRLPSTPTNAGPGTPSMLQQAPGTPSAALAPRSEPMTPGIGIEPGTPGARKRGRIPSTPTQAQPPGVTPDIFNNSGGMTPLLAPMMKPQQVVGAAPLTPSLIGRIQPPQPELAPADDGDNTPVPQTLSRPTEPSEGKPVEPTLDLGTPMVMAEETPRVQLLGEDTPMPKVPEVGGETPRVQLLGDDTPMPKVPEMGGETPRVQLLGDDTPMPKVPLGGEETPLQAVPDSELPPAKRQRTDNALGDETPMATAPTQELPTKTHD